MKKYLIFIILTALIGCEDLSEEIIFKSFFINTTWETEHNDYRDQLIFNDSTFVIIGIKKNNNEIISERHGVYTEEGNIAILDFDFDLFADHQAHVNENYLTLTNLSTGKSFQYEKK